MRRTLRSFRSLIDFEMPRAFFIKDLKALENGPTRFSIDIKVLKDLKRQRWTLANAGDRPPRYEKKTVLEPSRGTGPRATGTSSPEVSPTERIEI